ncbi:MAG: phosphate ABC transporter substrate-binding protein PstS family protein [Oscillospiraceae bacterium]|jgi:phosphate transport system substrate-binding protein|nr:phosphate ABC transporter substrate-binding protein PstS family protein [Oscillospiraceae bacterium]
MKKRITAFLTLALVAALILIPASAALAAPAITLEIDGRVVASDQAPIVKDGRTLVPVRVITETLGATVSWNQTSRRVTVETAGFTVVFTIGSKSYTVNGASKTLDVPPEISNGRTLVPIRALAESIGADVNYDAAANKATVNYFTGLKGSVKVSGSTTVLPIMQAAADELLKSNSGLSIAVAGGGSGAGINDTRDGANNVGMSSRELTADEKSTLNPVAVAGDGIAIIVHPSNPVKSLTKEQAAKIFLGEIKNWRDVGGNNAPIFVQTRETGSGTLSTLEEMLLEKNPVVGTATPFTSSALIKQAVAKSENAIGFDSIGFVDATVKAVALDGVTPGEQTVKDGSYPLSRSLYVLTKGRADGLSARLIDYLRTAGVQNNIVKKEGYISIY